MGKESLKKSGMLRGSATVLLQRVVEAIIGLYLLPFTLHRLGSELYGLWALVYSVITYFNIADLGFAGGLIRHFVAVNENEDDYERRSVFSTALAYLIGVAGIVTIAGIIFANFLPAIFPDFAKHGNLSFFLWYSVLYILAIGYVGSYARALFYASQHISSLYLLQTSLVVLNLILTIIVLNAGYGLKGLAIVAMIIATLKQSLTFIIGAKLLNKWAVGLKYVTRKTFVRLWSFGLKVLLARIAEIIYFQFDRVLLGRVLGVNSVTQYDVGAKAAGMANQLPLVLLPVIEPATANLYSNHDYEKFHKLILLSTKYMSITAFSLAGFLVASAPELLTLWLGSVPEKNMVLAIQFLAVAYLFVASTGPLRVSARGAGFPEWEAVSALIQALANIILSIGLYYVLGFSGVLIGTLSATIIGQIIFISKAIKGLKIPVINFMAKSWFGVMVTALISTVSVLLYKAMLDIQLLNGRVAVVIPVLEMFLIFTAVSIILVFAFRIITIREIKELIISFKGSD